MAGDMYNQKDYGSSWWQKARGYIVKWWTIVYTPIYKVFVPAGEQPAHIEDMAEPESSVSEPEVMTAEPVETEEEKQARLRSKALAELQAISDEDWKSREAEEQEKAADILIRLRQENEEREKAKQAELERIRLEAEAKEKALEVAQGISRAAQTNAEAAKELAMSGAVPESGEETAVSSESTAAGEEDDALLRAQEILARLSREAAIDEQIKQAEIDAAKAAQN